MIKTREIKITAYEFFRLILSIYLKKDGGWLHGYGF